jgi:predicted O-linked N-acetylglucosamine transferase (SPINDLY family)
MPIVNHFLKPFQINNKIISLEKYDLVSNAKLIEKHNFHIIFYPDLGMKQAQTLLAHNRLAPIQITTWGHSDTSGNPSIDYYITSKYFEQVKDLSIPKNNYSETPILLKELGTFYYSPRKIVKELLNPKFDDKTWMKTKKDFGFPENCIVIGCLQSFYKFNEDFEDMLYRILDITQSPKFIEDYKIKNGCSPKPVYMALSNSISFNKFHLERIRRKLDKFSDRIVWFQNKAPDEWMNLVSICHLMLDPFPFGGCNTTLEAIDYHIPVVYLPSLTMINGRFTHGFYQKMGINNFQTNSKKEYIDKVYQLLTNNAKYFTLKNEIRMKKTVLFENRECITEYQHMFIKLIERHIIDKKNMK